MTNMKQICLVLVVVCALFSTAAAQESSSQRSTLTITANATGERVRITAPSSVVQMHVEVYAASGAKLFDQEIRGGNVFDWHLQDGQARQLPAGDYVCLVTAKNISGRLTQNIGTVTIADNSVSVRAGDSQQFTAPQLQAIGPMETDSSWTVVAEGENQTTTVIANTGTEGQMIRGRGALTFRLGNFFSGIDTEQMRLTEAGDLGIGTAEPKAKLDVAGTVRAERFLVVKPDKLSSQAQSDSQTNDSANVQPLVSGVGTTSRLTKWTDGPSGTLGDSGITETAGGNVGIGTSTPNVKLEVSGDIRVTHGTGSIYLDTNSRIYSDGSYSIMTDLDGNPRYYFAKQAGDSGNSYHDLGSNTNGAHYFRSALGAANLMVIRNNGNVGIGTTAPGVKLDVAGTVNSSEQYNIRGNRVLTISGDENRNTFVGYHAGRTTLPISGDNNSFFGIAAGSNNNSGAYNTFLGALAGDANNSGSFNTFVGASTGGDTFPGAGDYITLLGYNTGFGFATNLDHATAIGAGAFVDASNTIKLGRSNGDDTVIVPGKLQIDTLAASGSTELCLNSNNRIGPCSSSSLRYKKAVQPFAGGLNILNRLQPIMFTWKQDGLRDLGLAAEDVALVEPMLTFKNKEGEIEGVKYNRVNLVLINAVKEQQQQIAALRTRLRRLEQALINRPEAKRRHR